MNRREFLGAGALALMPSTQKKAQIAITLDLEMSRNFPRWDDTHWDYEKGNLNDDTKRYAVEAGKRARRSGGVIHYFAVGQVFEQPSVDWLIELVRAGHPVGNHTYDHINVRATRLQDLQFRFQRAPWLIEGKQPLQVIEENIRLNTAAIKARLGVEPCGFRTPGGFANGLDDLPDVRRILRNLGFDWISSKYPGAHNSEGGDKAGRCLPAGLAKCSTSCPAFQIPRWAVGDSHEPAQRHRRVSHGSLATGVVSKRDRPGPGLGN